MQRPEPALFLPPPPLPVTHQASAITEEPNHCRCPQLWDQTSRQGLAEAARAQSQADNPIFSSSLNGPAPPGTLPGCQSIWLPRTRAPQAKGCGRRADCLGNYSESMQRMAAFPARRRKALWPGPRLGWRFKSGYSQISEGHAASDPRAELTTLPLPAKY